MGQPGARQIQVSTLVKATNLLVPMIERRWDLAVGVPSLAQDDRGKRSHDTLRFGAERIKLGKPFKQRDGPRGIVMTDDVTAGAAGLGVACAEGDMAGIELDDCLWIPYGRAVECGAARHLAGRIRVRTDG